MNQFRRLIIGMAGLALFAGSTTKAGPSKMQQAKYDRAADQHGFTTFMTNSGWCWFQDPRAILHHNKIVIGGVEGNGNGAAVIGVYDLAEKITGRTVVHEQFDRDDHNSPVFLPLNDGKLLTFYARHNKEKRHYYRFSQSEDLLSWGPEQVLNYNDKRARGNATYMNLYAMKDEGKIYNFFRCIAFNPCFTVSSDNGKTWGEVTHFIQNEVNGRQRPYARYAGNGADTIHVSFTDAHPRDFGNSLYYAAFRGGKFYKADGTLIKDLKADGPLRPSEADKVFQGGGGKRRGKELSANKAAWSSSITLDKKGNPHMGYTYYLSNTDNRYRIASWNGSKWVDREVAYGGKCLYDRESSYTGLITLDPIDPTCVMISTDVDPTTGKGNGGKHEIYRGKVGANDDITTIKWESITQGSPVHNIRPVILNKDGKRVVLWQRGDFKTFVNYELDTVGFAE